jgi:hypothetical protein
MAVSQRKYAEMRGVNLYAVQQAIKCLDITSSPSHRTRRSVFDFGLPSLKRPRSEGFESPSSRVEPKLQHELSISACIYVYILFA